MILKKRPSGGGGGSSDSHGNDATLLNKMMHSTVRTGMMTQMGEGAKAGVEVSSGH